MTFGLTFIVESVKILIGKRWAKENRGNGQLPSIFLKRGELGPKEEEPLEWMEKRYKF